MEGPILTELSSPVARITLNRPDQRNALNVPLLNELRDAIDDIETEDGVVCALIQANGEAFCGGGDVSLVRDGSADEIGEFLRLASTTLRRLEQSPVPFVCAVDGHALGGGLELVLAADLAVANRSARFGLPEATIGLIPAAGGTQRLPRIVGETRAKELILTGRTITGAGAAELGIINDVTENDAVERAEELAREIAESAPLSVAAAVRLITDASDTELDQGLEAEQTEAARILRSDDSQEGVEAFFEGREPEFRGK